MQRSYTVVLIGISQMNNEIEHSFTVYWPCVLCAFLTFTFFLIFLSQHSAFELYLCGGVGSLFFASDSCRVFCVMHPPNFIHSSR